MQSAAPTRTPGSQTMVMPFAECFDRSPAREEDRDKVARLENVRCCQAAKSITPKRDYYSKGWLVGPGKRADRGVGFGPGRSVGGLGCGKRTGPAATQQVAADGRQQKHHKPHRRFPTRGPTRGGAVSLVLLPYACTRTRTHARTHARRHARCPYEVKTDEDHTWRQVELMRCAAR